MSRWTQTLEERFWSKVEKTDTCWNWTASKINSGYGQFRVDGTGVGAHRLSYEMTVGRIPEGIMLDHTCHNRACVRPDHLRFATNKQNNENREGPQANSKSGVRGVSWHKASRKWRARLGHNGQKIDVGHFDNLAEAEAAVIAKRNELFTHNDIDRRAA